MNNFGTAVRPMPSCSHCGDDHHDCDHGSGCVLHPEKRPPGEAQLIKEYESSGEFQLEHSFSRIDEPVEEDSGSGFPILRYSGEKAKDARQLVVKMLEFIGEDPTREGLLETPDRVVRAWEEWFDGYGMDEKEIFKVFEDGAENVSSLVIVRDIPVEAWCEHHMARFSGVAHVGYIPSGKIVGLSKIARVVRMYSHRLQVQERLTNQIADSMQRNLNPLGVAVVINCEHTCMSSRGARVHGTSTITSAMRGVLMDEIAARAEFLSLLHNT